MMRIRSVLYAAAAATFVLPQVLTAQAHHDQGHGHDNMAVDCSTLATPPWAGLPDADRHLMMTVQQAVEHLSTPEAARAAGFQPALGDIPGMGVHYVHSERMRDGVIDDSPDHLLFSDIDGEPTLVGAAYAFRDVPDTQVPIPFDSDLAMWHDHPQFAEPGETLHMLHMWFIPSSNGPFAGLNFWLPYHNAGITPPSACWMANEEDADRIRRVSFSLVTPRGEEAARAHRARMEGRSELIAALEAAAEAEDHMGWTTAADRYLEDLTDGEQTMVTMLLRALTDAQMSSAQREGGIGR